MGVALDKFFETVQQLKAEEQHKNEIWKKTWHIEYCLFSFNKDMFGFVYHHWYPCGSWESPKSEYDYDYKKGFQLFDYEYKFEVWDNEVDMAKHNKEHYIELNGDTSRDFMLSTDWKFVLNIKCIPILVYKKECVGYIDGNGDKHYYKQIMKEHKKQAKKFFKGLEDE